MRNVMERTSYNGSGNVLVTESGARVEFQHRISDVVETDGMLVVCLEVMGGILTRNVFGVSADGRVRWQIPDVQPNRNRDCYVGLVALSDSSPDALRGQRAVLANRCDDLHVWLDPQTGNVLKHEWSKS